MSYKPNVLGADAGGTGLGTYAVGDILYASAPKVLTKLPAAADNSYLTLLAGVPVWAVGKLFSTAKVTLTNAQLKAINSSPITIVSAQGANKILIPLAWYSVFIYGGNNAFTGSNPLNLTYNGLNTSLAFPGTIQTAGVMVGTTTTERVGYGSVASSATTNAYINQPLLVTAAANFAGNAANDNTVTLVVNYVIVPTT